MEAIKKLVMVILLVVTNLLTAVYAVFTAVMGMGMIAVLVLFMLGVGFICLSPVLLLAGM